MIQLDLIMVDECGDEVKVKQFDIPELDWNDLSKSDNKSEDINPSELMLNIWEERMIEFYKERYPEARRFYFERPFSSYSLGALEEMADWL